VTADDGPGPTAQVAAAVTRYAEAFHVAAPDGHHVAGPLGGWLLLALIGPAAGIGPRSELGDVLGMHPLAARAATTRLLGDPHPAVAAAAAVWSHQDVGAPAFDAWLSRLPAQVTRGPVPSQAGPMPGPARTPGD